jgi:hypothetical protein
MSRSTQDKLVLAYLDQELGNFPVPKITAEVPHPLTALIIAHVMSTTEDGGEPISNSYCATGN